MSYYTEEEIRHLAGNPYTCSVTKTGIRFTLDFKEFVMREVKAGNTSVKIFKKAGYDPETIGTKRIYSFVKHIKEEAASPNGLRPTTEYKKMKAFAAKQLEKEKESAAIKELQEQVVYLEQQVAFLKKISLVRSGPPVNQK